MKSVRTVIITILCVLFFVNPVMANTDNPEVDIVVLPGQTGETAQIGADAAILMGVENGDILFSKDPHKKLYPASTTKILTGLLAIEHGDLDEIVTVGNEANLCTFDSSKAGIDIGEEISLKNLLYGLMLPSGNDAAYSIAVHIGRKVSQNSVLSIDQSVNIFVQLMNSKAREIGAKDSHFVNPDGYHDDSHYTTAYDMALIAREAMRDPIFRDIVGTTLFTLDDWSSLHDPKAEEKEIRYWWNSNSLIQPESKFHYPYATGIKTGYTSNAKHCLVSSASKDDMDLITVVLGCSKPGKWTETMAMFDYGFNNFEIYRPFSQNQQVAILNIENGDAEDWVRVLVKDSPNMIIPKGKSASIINEIKWNPGITVEEKDGKEVVSMPPPISKSQKVGTITLKLEGQVLETFDLISSKSIEIREPKPMGTPIKVLDSMKSTGLSFWSQWSLWKKVVFCVVIGVVLLLILARIAANRRRRRGYTYRRRY